MSCARCDLLPFLNHLPFFLGPFLYRLFGKPKNYIFQIPLKPGFSRNLREAMAADLEGDIELVTVCSLLLVSPSKGGRKWVFAKQNSPFQCLVTSLGVGWWEALVAPKTETSWPLKLSSRGMLLKSMARWWPLWLPLLQSILQFCKHYFPVLDPFLLKIPGVFLFCIKLICTIYHLHFIGEANDTPRVCVTSKFTQH